MDERLRQHDRVGRAAFEREPAGVYPPADRDSPSRKVDAGQQQHQVSDLQLHQNAQSEHFGGSFFFS